MHTPVSNFPRMFFSLFMIFAFVIPSLSQPGGVDPTFNTADQGTGGANGTVLGTVIQSDGKIIIVGGFTTYNGTARNYVARLNTDGSLDAGFNPGTGPNSTIQTTAIQSDGKIIIAGLFTSFNGTPRNNIARLNADGSLDAAFNPGTGTNSTIYSTAVQSDGKIIIGGTFTAYNGTNRNNIARLNTDGSLDTGFNPGTGAGGTGAYIYTMNIQSDGKIIIGGLFTFFNGTARSRIARLNTDGSVDAGFTPGTGANNTVRTIAVQGDGKIIIGGLFTTYNGTARSRIARLNSDGSLDAAFTPGTGADNTIFTTAIQGDGKVIIGGLFTTYNGSAINRFARINTDGSIDAGFNTGTGANNTIFTSAIQPDGKIIIGGLVTLYNGAAKNRIARILAGGGGSTAFDYFRTITSGNWNAPSSWESSPVADFSSGVISPATLAPDFNANAITVRGPHSISVTANVIAKQITLSAGGNLTVASGITLTVK